MKKIFIKTVILYLMFGSLVSVSQSESRIPEDTIQTTEHLMRGLIHGGSDELTIYVSRFAVNNPQMVKEILLLPSPKYQYQIMAKRNALSRYEASSYRGIISKREFFDVAFEVLKHYKYYNSSDRNKINFCYNLAHYGFGYQNYSYSTDKLLEFLQNSFSMLESIKEKELIEEDMFNKIIAKLAISKKYLERGNSTMRSKSVSAIESVIALINSNPSALQKDTAQILQKYYANLAERIRNAKF